MSPLDEYRARQAKWSAEKVMAQRSFIAIGNWRLATAVAAGLIAWFAFGWWLLAPVAVFAALVVWHQRVLRRRTFAERAIRFYEQGIGRLEDAWAGRGNTGEAYRDAKHSYADDLDVFGSGSLFELVSSARTAAGERKLAEWMLTPATGEEAKARQSDIRELAPKLDLREEMALLGEDIRSSVQAEGLTEWGAAARVPFPGFLRPLAFVLSLAGLTTLVLKLASVWPPWPLLLMLAVNGLVLFIYRKQTGEVQTTHDLGLLSLLIERLERERFSSPGLQQIQAALATQGEAASARIRRLNRWLDLLDSSDHVILRVLSPVLLYKQQVVMGIEAWRTQNGAYVAQWIQALAKFEALSSLGALHYERPDWCFPDLDEDSPAHFTATELGHPLLSGKVSVRNSLSLDETCRLLIVSGSNMSGKSTLLRAVGLNTVLAWAGAPVCATALRLSRLQVGASLRVSDSLQDNRSRFFAEISRLRQVVELTKGPVAVLFLLDELLSGTNSHDRRIGAAGVVRGLLAANTLGLLTTHDLALAQIDQDTSTPARNVHFEDRIIDGKMIFDYHLRPGVVTHSNALELMRSIGLEI